MPSASTGASRITVASRDIPPAVGRANGGTGASLQEFFPPGDHAACARSGRGAKSRASVAGRPSTRRRKRLQEPTATGAAARAWAARLAVGTLLVVVAGCGILRDRTAAESCRDDPATGITVCQSGGRIAVRATAEQAADEAALRDAALATVDVSAIPVAFTPAMIVTEQRITACEAVPQDLSEHAEAFAVSCEITLVLALGSADDEHEPPPEYQWVAEQP